MANLTEFSTHHVIPEVYILDSDFRKVDIIDDYTSLIWSRRYYETGDFELYCNASEKNIELLQIGNYVMRIDDDEIFRIETVEIETNVEEGDFITATGRDLRSILYQRVTEYNWTYPAMRIETLVRQIVYNNFVEPDNELRKVDNFVVGTDQGLTDQYYSQIEVECQNIGEWIEDICDNYSWGWRVAFNEYSTDVGDYELIFDVYKGEDKTDTVIFSEDYENLVDSSYKEDRTEYYNVMVVNDDDSTTSAVFDSKQASGLERYEVASGETDLNVGVASSMTWENWMETYDVYWNPNLSEDEKFGTFNYTYDDLDEYRAFTYAWLTMTGFTAWLNGYNFPLYGDQEFKEYIMEKFPNGEEVQIEGVNYWQVTDAILLAESERVKYNGWGNQFDTLGSDFYQSSKSDGKFYCVLSHSIDVPQPIQKAIMQTNAYASVSIYTKDVEFDGTIEPNITYTYKEDYDLGTLVTVRTKYGITKSVRISEVVETFDEDGYTIEVNFEAED